jgi:hypothetical protein
MTEVDLSNKGLQAGGAIIVAAWISHRDKGAMTSLNLAGNAIGGYYKGRYNEMFHSTLEGTTASLLQSSAPSSNAVFV